MRSIQYSPAVEAELARVRALHGPVDSSRSLFTERREKKQPENFVDQVKQRTKELLAEKR